MLPENSKKLPGYVVGNIPMCYIFNSDKLVRSNFVFVLTVSNIVKIVEIQNVLVVPSVFYLESYLHCTEQWVGERNYIASCRTLPQFQLTSV